MIISCFYGMVYLVLCIKRLSLFIFEINYGPRYMKVMLFLKKAIYNSTIDLDRENFVWRNMNEMFMEKSFDSDQLFFMGSNLESRLRKVSNFGYHFQFWVSLDIFTWQVFVLGEALDSNKEEPKNSYNFIFFNIC